jgi:hypothetical protein
LTHEEGYRRSKEAMLSCTGKSLKTLHLNPYPQSNTEKKLDAKQKELLGERGNNSSDDAITTPLVSNKFPEYRDVKSQKDLR